MKLIKLAHPSQVRSVPEGELDRLLGQGWVEIKKPTSRLAIRQRQFRQQRKAIGYKRFTAYLPPAVFAELSAVKLPSETNDELVIRLLLLLRMSDKNSQVEGHN